jgi:hypothetical protein
VYRAEGAAWRVRRATETRWEVIDDAGRALAYATTTALHPATVYRDEWFVFPGAAPGSGSGATLCFEHVSLASSSEDPVALLDLGADFFTRRACGFRIWYRCDDGTVEHSGAKRPARGEGRAGRRYCALCRALFSANNFVTQHMQLHPEAAATPPCEVDFANYVAIAPAAAAGWGGNDGSASSELE